MKIPDEYTSGSKPLDNKREDLALALVHFNVEVADDIIERKDFNEMLKLTYIDTKEKNRMRLELCIFNLYITSVWIMNNNNKENGKELLDRMYFHFRKAISGNDLPFGDIVEKRHVVYYKAITNTVGAGQMYWLGKEATLNILGKDEKNIDPEVLITAPLFFAGNFASINAGVKEMVG